MSRIPLINLSLIPAFVFALVLTSPSFGGNKEVKQTAISQNSQIDGNRINISNFSFTPATLTVPIGTKVTWINHDDVPHLVVSTSKGFTSPVLDTDDRFSYSFTAPGTYAYYCSIHPKMTAEIIVKERYK